jgi:dihydrofolate reductase
MRKIILNLAMSLDGYIADPEGKYDWIQGDGDDSMDTEYSFDFDTFTESIDILVMGRKSYDDIGVEQYEDKRVIVATSKDREDYDNVEFVNEDIVAHVMQLKEEEGGDIWLFGGSVLTDYFLKADIVDEFIVGIVPIILGGGQPLFFADNPTVELRLDSYTVQEGLPILMYSRR